MRNTLLIIFCLIFFSVSSMAQTQTFNPDMGVVGQLNVAQDNNGQYLPSIGEIELNLAAHVDPYSKAVFTLAFNGTEAEIEEGYLNILELPFETQARLGRIKVPFNHLNTLHPHDYPFVASPKYLEQYFGEAGLVRDGIDLSYLVPLPFYSELNLLWLSGPENNSFAENKESLGTRLKTFFEIAGNSGIEIGVSYLKGTNPSATPTFNYQSDITGANLRWKQYTGPQSYLIFSNEWLQSNYRQPADTQTNASFHYLGYQIDKQWQVGVGANHSQQPDNTSAYNDVFASFQYKWTEFQQYRFQYYREDNGNFGILMNLTFFIGPHPVHEF